MNEGESEEIDFETKSAGDWLDKVERYLTAFNDWGFDVRAEVSGENREDVLVIVRSRSLTLADFIWGSIISFRGEK